MGFKDVMDNLLNRGPARSHDLPDADLETVERRQQDILDKIEHQRKTRVGFGKFIKNPVKFLTENPVNVLYISVPLALVLLAGGFVTLLANYGISVLFSTTMVDDVAVFALLLAIIPLALLDFRESRRVNSIEESLPNFFRDVAGMNDSGMTLPHAIRIVSEGEYGYAHAPYPGTRERDVVERAVCGGHTPVRQPGEHPARCTERRPHRSRECCRRGRLRGSAGCRKRCI